MLNHAWANYEVFCFIFIWKRLFFSQKINKFIRILLRKRLYNFFKSITTIKSLTIFKKFGVTTLRASYKVEAMSSSSPRKLLNVIGKHRIFPEYAGTIALISLYLFYVYFCHFFLNYLFDYIWQLLIPYLNNNSHSFSFLIKIK